MVNLLRQICRAAVGIVVLPLALLAIVPVATVAGVFWLVSIATRVLARRLSPTPKPWNEFVEFDAELGWKSKSNIVAHYLVGEEMYEARTGDDGWRGDHKLAESQIVVIGDSFAWGYGVSEDEFFANLVADVKVKPIGVMGYNLAQEVLCLKKYQRQLAGKLVVWFLYYGNDLFETLTPDMQGYRQPFVKERADGGGWEIINRHLSEKKWLMGVNPNDAVYYEKLADYCSSSNGTLGREFVALAALLEQGRDICNAVGATLVVVSIPEKTQLDADGRTFLLQHGGDPFSFDAGFPDRITDGICQELNISFVAGMKYFDLSHYLKMDCHWNGDGHRRMAELLQVLWRANLSQRVTAAPASPKRLDPMTAGESRGHARAPVESPS
jgi:hypothetical protein